MHLISLARAIVPDRPQAGTALMNEVTLRNADAHTYKHTRARAHSLHSTPRAFILTFGAVALLSDAGYVEREKETFLLNHR